jgi:hypothetical protein
MGNSYSRNGSPFKGEAIARQIRTDKRSIAIGNVSPDDPSRYVMIKAIDTQWQPGTLRVLRCAQDDVPATGTVLVLRNRETGLDLGYYTVIEVPPTDSAYGHKIPSWTLSAKTDERQDRAAKNAPQASAQAVTEPVQAPAPAIVPATANRARRERESVGIGPRNKLLQRLVPQAPAPKPGSSKTAKTAAAK